MKLTSFELGILCVILCSVSRVNGLDYCYATEQDPYRYYGSITAYDEVVFPSNVTMPGCRAKRFYLVARHGTRYPSSTQITEIETVLPQILDDSELQTAVEDGTMCELDVAALNSWVQPFDEDQGTVLAPEGYREMSQLAERLFKQLPELGTLPYNESTHEFRNTYTDTDRTKESALAFAEGMLGYTEGITLVELPEDEDWLLYYYNLCEKYQQDVREKPLVEFEEFKDGVEMESVMRYVEDRLQLPTGYINYDNLSTIANSCIFEYGVYNNDNLTDLAPWCSLLPEDITKVLEYQEDLKYYWRDGYGVEINYEQACIVLDDIMAHFNDDTLPLITTRFAHSANLNTLYARLGLFYDDVIPTADNYEDQLDREFRMSHIGTMGSNIAFILYDCDEVEEDVIQVFVNEQPVTLPGCESAACGWDVVQEDWILTIGQCDMDEICSVDTSAATPVQHTTSWLFSVAFCYQIYVMFVNI